MAAQMFCPRCNQVSTNPAWDFCGPAMALLHAVSDADPGDGQFNPASVYLLQ